MNLHENKDAFIELVQKTSDELGIQDIFVEKDYWVTFVLKTLINWDTDRSVVFKGGTSLSKAYGLIDRFSEDVDLVLKDTKLTDNQIKTSLRNAQKKSIKSPLQEIDSPRTSKGSRFRKIDCTYPQILDEYSDFGEASSNLLVEFNSFGTPFPSAPMEIKSYIAEMLEKTHNQELIKTFGLTPFDVEILNVKQTFCEKLMGLMRISLKENYLDELRIKIRHFYDISKLLEEPEILEFIKTKDFADSLKNIYQNDTNTPEFKNDWPVTALKENKLLTDYTEILKSLESHFNSSFKTLLFRRESFEYSKITHQFESLATILSSMRLD